MKPDVPVWEKIAITLDEASAYSGIGINKLRSICEQQGCNFVFWVGKKRMIKRELFVKYIEKCYSI